MGGCGHTPCAAGTLTLLPPGLSGREIFACSAVVAAVVAVLVFALSARSGLALTTRVRLRLCPGQGFTRGRWALRHQDRKSVV